MSFHRKTENKSGCCVVHNYTGHGNYHLFCPQSTIGREELRSFHPHRLSWTHLLCQKVESQILFWTAHSRKCIKRVIAFRAGINSPQLNLFFFTFSHNNVTSRTPQAQQGGSPMLLISLCTPLSNLALLF